MTFYTWTSDQYSQYGTKVIPTTVRDATYVLDEILDNETDLPILEHTTDTVGYTEIIFALFDLLGLQFSPRICDLGDQQLCRLDRSPIYPNLEPRLKNRIRQDLIVRRWDDLLRVAGSLKRGWVTASLLISRLQSYRRQNALTRALQEYGRLIKTIFILRYLRASSSGAGSTRSSTKRRRCTPCASSCSSPTGARFDGSRRKSKCIRQRA